MYFDSERRFELRRIRDIRVRDIENRRYVTPSDKTQLKEEQTAFS